MVGKLLGTPLFPNGGKNIAELTPKERKTFQKRIQEAQRLRQLREAEARRRENMDLRFETNQRCHCGELIIYKSTLRFRETGEWRAGAPAQGYYQETVTVFCDGCALSYYAGHKRFAGARAEAKKQRQPPGEDWAPPPKKMKAAAT